MGKTFLLKTKTNFSKLSKPATKSDYSIPFDCRCFTNILLITPGDRPILKQLCDQTRQRTILIEQALKKRDDEKEKLQMVIDITLFALDAYVHAAGKIKMKVEFHTAKHDCAQFVKALGYVRSLFPKLAETFDIQIQQFNAFERYYDDFLAMIDEKWPLSALIQRHEPFVSKAAEEWRKNEELKDLLISSLPPPNYTKHFESDKLFSQANKKKYLAEKAERRKAINKIKGMKVKLAQPKALAFPTNWRDFHEIYSSYSTLPKSSS